MVTSVTELLVRHVPLDADRAAHARDTVLELQVESIVRAVRNRADDGPTCGRVASDVDQDGADAESLETQPGLP